ncbi:TetR/AcrR family transcriptional regulator [Kibdelosporangium phytohabitans]|uniref:TetR family transcriptional regulator n=1 Tax=Kibdelosporangium phytohabitans TaxID=860235 RepID=A0A0N9HYC7_9PSEU|nr:TetR/AcrR family transcriptional regulator [Kibdelosporangium phytohabitans]ALG12314.1 TetR family transcriptional regulator [Kibdelosporangium phytohabitans]MBE1463872.1 AcrR family transcriptional regulator [Kibdelosporangium phytohabitans]
MRADAKRNRAKILAAAEEVFVAAGSDASTEEVARRAGVAIGTVFRHFPTKNDLLAAIMKELADRLAGEAETLAAEGDPATALFTFFAGVVEQAAGRKTVVELLDVDIRVDSQLQTMRDAIGALLTRAQQAGAVRAGVRLDEVMALLTATSAGALRAGWDRDLRTRTLDVVFAGLRPR